MAKDADQKLRDEWDEASAAFRDAKKTRATHPAAYERRKAKVVEMRRYWREIGEACGTRVAGASAIPDEE